MSTNQLTKLAEKCFTELYFEDQSEALAVQWNEMKMDVFRVCHHILRTYSTLEKHELFEPYPIILEMISCLTETRMQEILGSEVYKRLENVVVELKSNLEIAQRKLSQVTKERDSVRKQEAKCKEKILTLQKECRQLKIKVAGGDLKQRLVVQGLQCKVVKLREESKLLEKRTQVQVNKLNREIFALRKKNRNHEILEHKLKKKIEDIETPVISNETIYVTMTECARGYKKCEPTLRARAQLRAARKRLNQMNSKIECITEENDKQCTELEQYRANLVPLGRKQEIPKLQRIITEQRAEIQALKGQLMVLDKATADRKSENEKLEEIVNNFKKLYYDEKAKNKDLTAALKRKSEQLEKSQLESKMKSAHTTPVRKLNQQLEVTNQLEVRGVSLQPISNKFQMPIIVPRVTKNGKDPPEDKSASSSVPKNELKHIPHPPTSKKR